MGQRIYVSFEAITNMENKRGKILIYGAGAIGRGFLAPTFSKLGYEIYFVDKNKELITELNLRNTYKTAFSKGSGYEIVSVPYSGAFMPGEEDEVLSLVDFVFTCVGPDNFSSFASKLINVPSVISFENEYESVQKLKELSSNYNCFFGVPDVITSNEAPSELKAIDKLCLVSEKGEYAIEKGNFVFPEEIPTYSKRELQKYWACKFYLHNTPHATAAFLGKMFGCEYLHEAMRVPAIRKAVESVMDSTKKAMKIKKLADDDFIDFYAEKEIERFSDPLLFDPIIRVGREPLRKLRKNDRLVGSLKFISETNQDPTGALLTIKAAIYDVLDNYNQEASELLVQNPTEELILEKISGIACGSQLFNQIISTNLFRKLFFIEDSLVKVNQPVLFRNSVKIISN